MGPLRRSKTSSRTRSGSGSGERTIQSASTWLNRLFGPNQYPPQLAGDLADLLDSLTSVRDRLSALLEAPAPRRGDALRELSRVRLEISDDLPMILADIERSLDQLKKPATK